MAYLHEHYSLRTLNVVRFFFSFPIWNSMEAFSSVNFGNDNVTVSCRRVKRLCTCMAWKETGAQNNLSRTFFFFFCSVQLSLDYISQDTPLMGLIQDWLKQ